jgi:hypothetical protein
MRLSIGLLCGISTESTGRMVFDVDLARMPYLGMYVAVAEPGWRWICVAMACSCVRKLSRASTCQC